MAILNYFIWSADPEFFSLGGVTVRWYGLLFALGFFISLQIMTYMFRKEGKPVKDVDTLTIHMLIATIIGARLGHVLFYEPAKYLSNPVEILKVWEGGLASHGGAIGILIALFIYSNYKIFVNPSKFSIKTIKEKREGQRFLWIVDRIVIVVALTGCLIRIGNFMNSEIVGKPTESNLGVLFARMPTTYIHESAEAIKNVSIQKRTQSVSEITNNAFSGENDEQFRPITITIDFNEAVTREKAVKNYINTRVINILADYDLVNDHIDQPISQPIAFEVHKRNGTLQASIYTWGITRHPAQLYEAACYLVIFVFLFLIWQKRKDRLSKGFLFGLFLILVFSARFIIEFMKANQVEFEQNIPLNMGQWLSIPLVLTGFIMLWLSQRKPKTAEYG